MSESLFLSLLLASNFILVESSLSSLAETWISADWYLHTKPKLVVWPSLHLTHWGSGLLFVQEMLVGHPLTVKGRPTICFWLWFPINPLIKHQNFCREIYFICNRFQWHSSYQVWRQLEHNFFRKFWFARIKTLCRKSCIQTDFLTCSSFELLK